MHDHERGMAGHEQKITMIKKVVLKKYNTVTDKEKPMKYMHFNSSCSYTALAMLLEEKGINTEDTEIALEIGLPWIFDRRDDRFLAGPNLQGAEWFDIYLNPRGLRMLEESIDAESVPDYLVEHGHCMLGIRLPGNNGKHAVVFHGYDGSYRFYNPVHEGSGASAELVLGKEELMQALDRETMVGSLIRCAKKRHDMRPVFERSVSVLRQNLKEIEGFSGTVHEPDEYRDAMDRLFRPLLLDGISMLKLAGEKDLAGRLENVQRELLQFLKGDRSAALADNISLDSLRDCAGEYIGLIERHIKGDTGDKQ